MGLLKWILGCSQKNGKRGTVDYNAHKMRKKYPLTQGGYFGKKGENRRVIYSENQYKESKRFYSKVSKGGRQKTNPNGRIKQKIMKDDGVVTYREKTSTKDSPAVDFGKMKGQVKNQRIHFIKKENDDD
ncbi:MAG: hypothetical protein IJB97_08235 [Clostridia bacterium]|nr:hypothetical protein [Clostridia bacterium]